MQGFGRGWRVRDGVNLAGYFLAESGVGEHVRTMLATLDEAGIPVAPVLFRETRSRQLAQLPDIEWSAPLFPVSLVCVNADQTPLFFERHPEVREGRYTIGYWHWEVEEFPDSMAASARLVDEIWTASEHSRAAIACRVDRPVRVVWPAVDPPTPAPPPKELLPPGDGLLFLSCFDFDSVVERKNPAGAIEAFRIAFPEPLDGHRLLVKSVNGDQHSERRAELERLASGRPDILFVDGFLTRAEHAGLIEACDVFLSLHRAEGFGLMLAEAMAAGKLVIATDYGGSREFLDAEVGIPVPWRPSPIPPGAGPYTGSWAEPDLAAAATAIAAAVAGGGALAALRESARWLLLDQHSPAARADLVRDRLATIEMPASAAPVPALPSDATLERIARLIEGAPGAQMPRRWIDRLRLRAQVPFWRFQSQIDRELLAQFAALEHRLEERLAGLSVERSRLELLVAGLRRRLDRCVGTRP